MSNKRTLEYFASQYLKICKKKVLAKITEFHTFFVLKKS